MSVQGSTITATLSNAAEITATVSIPEVVTKTKDDVVIEALEVTQNGTYNEDTVDGYKPVTVNIPDPVIEPLEVTSNGTYEAETADGYNPVTVNVPIPEPVIKSLEVTANGTYEDDTIDGYMPVTVAVPIPEPVISALEITANGTYEAPEGTDGYNPITVEVPDEPAVTEQIKITENGVYTPDEGVDGFDTVTVDVPDPVIEELTVTENGTYAAPAGVDGYNPINVSIETSSTGAITAIDLSIGDESNFLGTAGYWSWSLQRGGYAWSFIRWAFNNNIPIHITAYIAGIGYWLYNTGTSQATSLPALTPDNIYGDIYLPTSSVITSYLANSEYYIQDLSGITIHNLNPTAATQTYIWRYCPRLRHLPVLEDYDFSAFNASTYGISSSFGNMSCLKELPLSWMQYYRSRSGAGTTLKQGSTNLFVSFYACNSIDLPPMGVPNYTGSAMSISTTYYNPVSGLYSCKHFVLHPSSETAEYYYSSHVIQMASSSSNSVGIYPSSTGSILSETTIANNWSPYIYGYVTMDDYVYDDESYERNKDNDDYFTNFLEYSHYNHDSAVETINSLPYLYSMSTSCEIRFNSLAGSKTDGGAIGNLTDEELAVATDKGWTVTMY